MTSVTNEKLVEPFMSRMIFINRCFEFARMFNTLFYYVRNAENIPTFKRNLKTFIFMEAYNLDTNVINHQFCS